VAIGDLWGAVHVALALPVFEATINLEYYRFNYQLSNEINFSGLISVLDAEVWPLEKEAHAAASP
jgi:hypothetical protein